ncbi:MAG: glycoside hydrolase family 18 [Rikenellaceae bacterium]|nr:glycoside hydrolase family 18 [Rikenellaceae bacterium]
MKLKDIKTLIACIIGAAVFTGCSDWTQVESIEDMDFDATVKSDEYYAALREWKKTPGLPQVFVWFDNWTGVAPAGDNSMRGLPDSVTIASNWGGHPKFELSEDRKADMKYVQEVKGTKVVVTLFSAKCGDDMEWDDIYDIGTSTDETVIRPAIRKYAEAIYDACVESGYDGFDWDYEPQYGGQTTANAPLWRVREQAAIFVDELTYWFGPGSQRTDRDGRKEAVPGLLLLIDGEVGIGYSNRACPDWPAHYIDYYVLQAYGGGNLNSRVAGVISDFSTWINEGYITAEEVVHRTILTENFESYANTGGGFLNMSQYIYTQNGMDQQIGGCGIYRSQFDYNQGKGDYNGSPEYYYLRQGITNIYRIFNERQNSTGGDE